MTVKELKEFLNEIPDDVEVYEWSIEQNRYVPAELDYVKGSSELRL